MGEPIAIRALKRFAMDWGKKHGLDKEPVPTAKKNNIKVAVIGSGPGGLTAAYELGLKGYDVTVFESHPVAGGMLAVGIPEHRLPNEVLRSDIEYIQNTGVIIKTNTTLDEYFTIDDRVKEG